MSLDPAMVGGLIKEYGFNAFWIILALYLIPWIGKRLDKVIDAHVLFVGEVGSDHKGNVATIHTIAETQTQHTTKLNNIHLAVSKPPRSHPAS